MSAFSANVSGLFGTAAVRLNDNLLERSREAEILGVMGHETPQRQSSTRCSGAASFILSHAQQT